MSIGDYITSGLGRLQDNLFQVDPNVAGSMSPTELKGARNNALLHLGLGIIAGNRNGNGLGRAALLGLSDAENSFGQQTGLAYQLNRQKAQDAEASQMRTLQMATLTAPGLGRLAGGMDAAPDKVTAWHSIIGNPANVELLKAAGIDPATVTPQNLPQIMQQMHDQSAAFSPPAPIDKVGPGDSLIQNGKPVYTAPAAPEKTNLQRTDSGLTFNPTDGTYRDSTGKALTTAQVASREASLAAQRSYATTTASNRAKLDGLPKDGMDYWVEWSLQHGGSAPPGSRSPQFLASFGLAMKQRAQQDGNPMAAQIADSRIRQSLTPAITQTEKQIAANGGFLKTLESNIASADSLAQRVGGNTSPAINTIFNKWKRGVKGDPDVRAFDVWNNAIQGEAAKIASGGVGSVSASSDSQISKQVKLMQTADNYAAWRAAADAMIQEGNNRMGSLNDQIQVFRTQSIGGTPTPTPTPTPAAAKTVVRLGTQNGKRVAQFSDGTVGPAP